MGPLRRVDTSVINLHTSPFPTAEQSNKIDDIINQNKVDGPGEPVILIVRFPKVASRVFLQKD